MARVVTLDLGKNLLVCDCGNPFLRLVGEASGSTGYTNTYRCNQCGCACTLAHHDGVTKMNGCQSVPA